MQAINAEENQSKERKIPVHKVVMTGVREAGLCTGPLDTQKQGGVNLQEPFPLFCLVLFIAVFQHLDQHLPCLVAH